MEILEKGGRIQRIAPRNEAEAKAIPDLCESVLGALNLKAQQAPAKGSNALDNLQGWAKQFPGGMLHLANDNGEKVGWRATLTLARAVTILEMAKEKAVKYELLNPQARAKVDGPLPVFEFKPAE